MAKRFHLYYKDLTEDAKKRLMEFDPTVPASIINSEESIFSAKLPDGSKDGERLTGRDAIDGLRHMLEGLTNRDNNLVKQHATPEILAEANRRIEAGEDVAGISIDTRDGSAKYLTKAEALEMAREQSAHGMPVDYAPLDDSKCDDCEKNDCPANPNKDIDNSHIGERGWKRPN